MRLSAAFKSALQKPHLVFVLLALPFSIISSFTTPVLTVADETQHLLRAYSVATGNILSNKQASSSCVFPKNIIGYFDSYRDSPTIKTPQQSTFLDSSMDYGSTADHACGTASAYSSTMYAPQSLGILFSKMLGANLHTLVIVGRLFNAVFFCFVLYFIIKKARLGKWALVAIGLLPISIHYAGSLSADPINNLVVLGFVVFVFNLFAQRDARISNKQTLVLAALVALVALTKPQNLALLVLLAFLPVKLFTKNPKKILPLRINLYKWLTVGSLLIIALLVYELALASTGTDQIVSSAASHKIISDPLFFAHILWSTYISPFTDGAYGSFVFNNIVGGFSSYAWYLPSIVTFLCMSTLAAALLYRNEDETAVSKQPTTRLIIGSLLSLALAICLITYAMYTAWATLPMHLGLNATFAQGVQGRYFTATLILLLPVMLMIGRHLRIKPKNSFTFGLFIFASFFISLTIYTICSIQYLKIY